MGIVANQRVLQTKQRIYQSFLKLLTIKSIHQISISELCKTAKINRTTFYNHYGSQYDVLKEMSDNYLNNIGQMITEADAQDKADIHHRVTLVLQYMLDNIQLSALLMNNNLDETFALRFFSLPQIGMMLDMRLGDLEDARIKKATISFAVYGSYKLLQDWINDENRCSPSAAASLILNLAERVVFIEKKDNYLL